MLQDSCYCPSRLRRRRDAREGRRTPDTQQENQHGNMRGYRELILEDVDLAGVDKWADSAVVIRLRIKVRPLQQWAVKREFLRRLKAAFDAQGIEIPYPHLTPYAGQFKDGTAPRFHVMTHDT